MSDREVPSTSWAVWAWQAYREGRLVEANSLPARVVGEYTLAPHLQKIVDGAKTAPQWDTQADRLAALPAVGVGVKPLVWDGWVTCHEATATTGQYVVQDEGDEGWGMWTPEQPEDDHPHSFHPTIEAAKAAAQADYEARDD